MQARASPARNQTNRRRKSSSRKSPILSSVTVTTGSDACGGTTGAATRAVVGAPVGACAVAGAPCCAIALRRALAIRSSALISESAADGEEGPEAAGMMQPYYSLRVPCLQKHR
ncbi:exported hypothetical protein [Mesorhizobium metallidurans STM 2683]|uniref:Uncharacterized protein n=1 Tax=Mesorhizobium metallidurans STM 2683 TaxID=1297569 RepID=M5ETN3_9HYPH|nr:exported hypothetical protein [Mesorhizobium metallidurans STM 2683]